MVVKIFSYVIFKKFYPLTFHIWVSVSRNWLSVCGEVRAKFPFLSICLCPQLAAGSTGSGERTPAWELAFLHSQPSSTFNAPSEPGRVTKTVWPQLHLQCEGPEWNVPGLPSGSGSLHHSAQCAVLFRPVRLFMSLLPGTWCVPDVPQLNVITSYGEPAIWIFI